ncbi:amidohydrolase [Candidatus Woesearchaeota archaeon]|nr:amidohydrolase [Candidatus Woesearchaeota archaeon]
MSIIIKNVSLNHKKKDIYIEDNKIKEINDSINTEADHKIDGKNKAAIPSFVNAHTHAAMTLMRGYADDMNVMDWLQQKIWPLEEKMTEKDVYWGSKLACLEMIKSGTTFFNDMYWHFHGTARAVEETGIRAAISEVFIDLFDENKADENIKLNKKVYEEVKKYSDKVMFALGPHSMYTVSKKSLVWAKEFSDKNDVLIHIHTSESKKEVDDCLKQHKMRPIEYLEKIGVLGPRVLAAHSIWVNDKEIQLLKKYGVKIAHNPSSNMKLSSGVLPYDKMKGLCIALGTDGCASNNNLDMIEEMKFAALLQKAQGNPTTMPAVEAFKMATINGAKAFKLNMGEIKEGKLADLLLINLKDINLTPAHHLISNLVYSANGSCVDTTICDGKVLMQNRKVKDEEEILEKASEVAKNLTKR